MPTFDTPQPIRVTVELGAGDVRIVATDRADTNVEVNPTDPTSEPDVTAAKQTRVEYSSGRLLVKAPRPGGFKRYAFWQGGDSVDILIGLPAGSQLQGESATAAFHCSGRLGKCHLKTGTGEIQLAETGPVKLTTGAGDISLERATGDTELTAGSGAIWVGSIHGPATVKAANGDTRIGELTADLRISTANGAIVVDRAQAGVSAKTAKGDIQLGQLTRGAVTAQTGFGKVDLGVGQGVCAWLDLNTGHGTVRSELNASRPPEPGEETVEVHARSGFGDISVRRSLAAAAD